jgi:D-alanyl-D-alanine dipeptidase
VPYIKGSPIQLSGKEKPVLNFILSKLNQHRPIEQLGSVEGWKTLRIDECGERLVPLGAFSDYRQIATDAIYAGERQSSPYPSGWLKDSLITVFVREGVAKRLSRAARMLPAGHMLLVWDAYRPLTVQRALFDYYVEVLENRGVSREKAIADAQQFVSIPSDDPTRPPPHNTGGAVDLTIITFSAEAWRRMRKLQKIAFVPETKDNWHPIYEAEVEMLQIIREASAPIETGTVFDMADPNKTPTRYYESLVESGQRLTEDETRCLRNRRMLCSVMTAAGFSNYAEEWWHYDFGNQFDSARTGRPARYGAATFSAENARWEQMRQGHYFGSVAISKGTHPGETGKVPHPLYSFVKETALRTGDLRNTKHPQAAAL